LPTFTKKPFNNLPNRRTRFPRPSLASALTSTPSIRRPNLAGRPPRNSRDPQHTDRRAIARAKPTTIGPTTTPHRRRYPPARPQVQAGFGKARAHRQ
jgi:hypothetical protein